MEIFDYEERRTSEALESVNTAINEKLGIIIDVSEQEIKPDYPKIRIFHAIPSNPYLYTDGIVNEIISTGISTDEDTALLKALSEAMERYSAAIYKNSNFINSSFSKLKVRALNPKEVAGFSKEQLKRKSFEQFKFDENSEFNWTDGISLITEKKILVPAQLVYWNYKFNGEPIIQLCLSNGVAGGTSYAGATLRGIFEVVERENFMITWLNKLPGREVDFTEIKNSYLEKLVSELKKFKIEVHVFESATDIKVHSFISILFDRTGNFPIIGCGLKVSLDAEKAIIGAIEEAFLSVQVSKNIKERFPGKKIKPTSISTLEERILFWNMKGMLKELDFLLKNKGKIKISDYQNYSTGSCLKDLKFMKKELKEKNLETIVVDITPRDVALMGFKEVKILIPKMQPLYLDEKYKYLGGKRLYEVPKILGFKQKKEEELNKTPHPFL